MRLTISGGMKQATWKNQTTYSIYDELKLVTLHSQFIFVKKRCRAHANARFYVQYNTLLRESW